MYGRLFCLLFAFLSLVPLVSLVFFVIQIGLEFLNRPGNRPGNRIGINSR